jgi:2-polyprenyl-6-methoxyphenol hydroxylase-like FAD-dependent oxidoreductase
MTDEVAIVGAGPTGLLRAGDPAAAGVPRTVLDLTWLPSRFAFMLITLQYRTDGCSERRARALGARIVEGVEVTGCDRTPTA